MILKTSYGLLLQHGHSGDRHNKLMSLIKLDRGPSTFPGTGAASSTNVKTSKYIQNPNNIAKYDTIPIVMTCRLYRQCSGYMPVPKKGVPATMLLQLQFNDFSDRCLIVEYLKDELRSLVSNGHRGFQPTSQRHGAMMHQTLQADYHRGWSTSHGTGGG
jgi:hypothetical protein